MTNKIKIKKIKLSLTLGILALLAVIIALILGKFSIIDISFAENLLLFLNLFIVLVLISIDISQIIKLNKKELETDDK